jgi:hypothetical protein
MYRVNYVQQRAGDSYVSPKFFGKPSDCHPERSEESRRVVNPSFVLSTPTTNLGAPSLIRPLDQGWETAKSSPAA